MINNTFNRLCMFIAIFLQLVNVNAATSQAYRKISFTNVGFSGTYNPVSKLNNIDKDTCSCEVGSPVSFGGANAPLADYVSVHFRGPLTLKQFAFYSSSSFVININRSSVSWDRMAYYDASSQTSQNITFLTKAGDSSPCLGKALSYASKNGTGYSSASTILEQDNYISSDQEYTIYSNVSCPSSGSSKGCGVYRSGIPAYYGFGGVTKMFLFEFEMPTETQTNSTSFEYYDLPAIWLLNDQIARTSQYPSNTNCSCWSSGCGEFDIFEIMNGTERNNLYSTFHTYQGIADLGTGIQADGHFSRNTTNTMKGGVVFDSNGDVISFLSPDIEFNTTYAAEKVIALVSGIPNSDTYSTQLAVISTSSATATKSKSSGSTLGKVNSFWYYFITAFTAIIHTFMI
ncbi:hypothetical protein Kpol_2002p68 [Vanderwaltozyma polyspora DSM 70294]|uniref:glucan endo-1,3-beta-D-glucosidase n=1 Tax=Vanderwaltozyma polyspora (strain ATCC 22028 / DSM 70294 / BCRC 21397 / CBS 2163 / NBRC 10782 / NRRL Y-8283 / UCD 57-17) TaxID=436907 RepID=A7TFI3_VANPO|nr:uncharacterized protein Kpol_2002p68 [Vanderwaltozyma polyspora DSM 70294]EDO18997.1 hypothetical protein Kpol_2002p68 [Vanderwaltozyma polyspora DSM 70294]